MVCSSATHFGTRAFAVAGPALETVGRFKTALQTPLPHPVIVANCLDPPRPCNDPFHVTALLKSSALLLLLLFCSCSVNISQGVIVLLWLYVWFSHLSLLQCWCCRLHVKNTTSHWKIKRCMIFPTEMWVIFSSFYFLSFLRLWFLFLVLWYDRYVSCSCKVKLHIMVMVRIMVSVSDS